jgi:LysM repeat protein
MINTARLLWFAAACMALAACAPPPTPAIPVTGDESRSAIVGEMVGTVSGKASPQETLAPVSLGFRLGVGGQVQTGADAKARLDFSDQSILRLAGNSSYTLDGVETQSNGTLLTRITLITGTLWASLTGGELQVNTPVGVASVRGSFALFQFDPANQLLRLDCIEGSCAAGGAQLGNLERLVLSPTGSLRQTLAAQDVQAFVQENPESARVVSTLTAAPPASATATSSGTPTAVPSATEAATATSTPSPTETFTPPLPTALTLTPGFTVLGVHRVQPGDTITCIGRGYGVVPEAIILANALQPPYALAVNQPLNIPAVRWNAITQGPVCRTQFRSPYPGLPTSTLTPTPTKTGTSTATVTPSVTPTLAGTATTGPTPTATGTATLTGTPTITVTPSPTVSPTRDPKLDFGWSVQNVTLNGTNPATVAPGAVVTVKLDYQIWNAQGCPACIDQLVVGIGAAGQYCAYDGIPNVHPGASGTHTGTLRAPDAPGTYTVTVGYDLQFGCADALRRFTGGTTIGTIIVQ